MNNVFILSSKIKCKSNTDFFLFAFSFYLLSYALIWKCFFVAESNRPKAPSENLPPLPVETLLFPRGSNVSLKCSQIEDDEDLFITNVDWLCYNCGLNGKPENEDSKVGKVASFGHGGRHTLLSRQQQFRRRLVNPNRGFSLEFRPLYGAAEDEGDYFCLVNGEERPKEITKLLVKGKDEVGCEGKNQSSFTHSLSSIPPIVTFHHLSQLCDRVGNGVCTKSFAIQLCTVYISYLHLYISKHPMVENNWDVELLYYSMDTWILKEGSERERGRNGGHSRVPIYLRRQSRSTSGDSNHN